MEFYFNHDAPFVVTQGHVVRPFEAAYGPNSFQAVVQGAFQAVGIGMPNPDGSCDNSFCFQLFGN